MKKNRHRFVEIKSVLFLLISILLLPKVGYVVAADASTLETLFYTSTERHEIDRVRFRTGRRSSDSNSGNGPGNGGLKNGVDKDGSIETVMIEGFIKREDGKNVIWYNNTSTLNDSKIGVDLKFRPGSIVNNRINIVSNNKRIRLKPGQVLQVLSGKIQDQYKIQDSTAKLKIESQ